MKDIKIKPTNTKPKILEKAGNIPKDAKSIMKEHLLSQTDNLKPEFKDKSQENATDYATDKVEGGMQHTAYEGMRVANNAKDYAVKKIKEHRAEKKLEQQVSEQASDVPQQNATPETQNANAPKTKESVMENSADSPSTHSPQVTDKIKTRESVSATPQADTKPDMPIKTKEEYIKAQGKARVTEIDNTPKTLESTIKAKNADISQKPVSDTTAFSVTTPDKDDIRKIKSKEYVMKKQEQKKELEKVNQQTSSEELQGIKAKDKTPEAENSASAESKIKTKENYRASQQGGNAQKAIKTKETSIKSVNRTEIEASRLKSLPNKTQAQKAVTDKAVTDTRIKQRITQKSTIKTRSISKGKPMQKTKGIKTSKKLAKKANPAKIARKQATAAARKKAAKKAAQETAKRTAQAAKATAKAIKVIAVKAAQLIAAAAKAVGSAIAALGGWAVLLILLIIVIIVAAIAASPFGIFISDEAADTNSIPISSIVAECNVELSTRLTEIEDNTPHNRVVMEGGQANWDEIIAIFAVKTAGTGDETAQDVVVIDDAKKQKLKDVFWDMNSISSRTETVTSGETTETVLYITITAKTKDEMITQYGFTDKQKEALETLLENNDVLISATQSLAISDATAKDVLQNLPDNLSAERKAVVKAACSLVGKVNYFWGGKSSVIGWDSNWGKMALVTAEGSRSSGSMRPFGLDCSGFVTWCFINSSFNANAIGHGTQGQIAKCTRISLNSAQPGDLAFYDDISHVGIVAGKDASGNVLVIHCSSGANNVVITTGGFGFGARPSCY